MRDPEKYNPPLSVATVSSCKACWSKELMEVANLGSTPLADKFPKDIEELEHSYPLVLMVCEECFLLQLNHSVNPAGVFDSDYQFFTAGSPSLIKHFDEYAESVMSKQSLTPQPFVIDIASNDGTLLEAFKKRGAKVLGIEPAQNVANVAESKGIHTVAQFFSEDVSDAIAAEHGKAEIITANNVVAHVPDLTDFFVGVKKLLKPDGRFIFEVHHAENLIFQNQFDNIYHEHLSYFLMKPLIRCLKKLNMEPVHVKKIPNQGGSLRITVMTTETDVEHDYETVDSLVTQETQLGLYDLDTYRGYGSRIDYVQQKLREILYDLNRQGKTVYGYGASAKSTTLLNYCMIGTNLVKKVHDVTPSKIGRFTPATKIPIVERVGADYPDYYLCLVWNYLPDILKRETEFIKNGGKFILPLPLPRIVS